MKIIHVVPVVSKKVLPLYDMLKNNQSNEHFFMVNIGEKGVISAESELLAIKGLITIPDFSVLRKVRRCLFISKICSEYDVVIWHSLSTNGGLNSLILGLKNGLNSKSLWVVDDRENIIDSKIFGKRFSKLSSHLSLNAKKKIKYIGLSNISNEENLIENNILRAKTYVSPYPNFSYFNLCKKNNDKNGLIVQIGLGAYCEEKHFELIEMIKSIGDEVEFYLPLPSEITNAYVRKGSEKYANSVISRLNMLCNDLKISNRRLIFYEYSWIVDKGIVDIEKIVEQMNRTDVLFTQELHESELSYLEILLKNNVRIFVKKENAFMNYLNSLGANLHLINELFNEEESLSIEKIMQFGGSNYPKQLELFFDNKALNDRWEKIIKDVWCCANGEC